MAQSVYIIILTWNHIVDTIECLDSVFKSDYSDIHVVVVDNASSDNTVQIIREKYPCIDILENGQNLGYAEGNNEGIRYSASQGADYVFILNNDTVLDPQAISFLVKDLEENPNAIATVPISYLYALPQKVYFAGGRVTEQGEPKHLNFGDDEIDNLRLLGSTITDWINGCAILIRVSYLQIIGLFDPRFFVIFEDADWSFRARQAGYQLRVVSIAKIWHKSSASLGGSSQPKYIYYSTRNRHLWLERNFSIHQRIPFHIYAVKNDFRTLKNFIKIIIGRTAYHRAIRQGYVDYIFRRFHQRKYNW